MENRKTPEEDIEGRSGGEIIVIVIVNTVELLLYTSFSEELVTAKYADDIQQENTKLLSKLIISEISLYRIYKSFKNGFKR